MDKTKKRRIQILAASVFWLGVWQAAAVAIGQEVFLVSPVQAIGTLAELLPQAVDVILETKQASVSMLQRRLKLGYSRAARMVDQMEEMGIVGPFEGSKPRKILITKQQWQEMQYVQGTAPSEVLQAQTDFADDNEEEPEDDES